MRRPNRRWRGVARGDRHAGVAAGAYARLDRDAAEHLQLQLPGDGAAAAGTEDVVLHCAVGQMKPDMFSTTPMVRTFTLVNMAMALRASIRLTSCGVVTTTARQRDGAG